MPRVARWFAGLPVVRTVLLDLLRVLFFARLLASPGQRRHARRWLQSLRRDYLLDRAMPWLTFDAIDALAGHVRAGMRVFEYGSGGSTLFWLRHGAACVSVEHDAGWYARLHARLADNPAVDYRLVPPEPIAADAPPGDPADPEAHASADPGLRRCTFRAYAAQIDAFPDGTFAVVSVDGRARAACIMHAARKVAVGGILILDNAERAYYTERAGAFLRGFTRVPFFGVGPCGAAMWRTDLYRRES